jgi:hypothetical protein
MNRHIFWKSEMFGLQWLFACLCYATAPRETISSRRPWISDEANGPQRTNGSKRSFSGVDVAAEKLIPAGTPRTH